MAHKFTATHGVHFTDQVKDENTGELLHEEWAAFKLDPSVDEKPSKTGQRGGVGSRTYTFETGDAKVADRLRKLDKSVRDEYGIEEDKSSDTKAESK